MHGPSPAEFSAGAGAHSRSSIHASVLQHRNVPFQTVSHAHHAYTPPSRSSQPPAHPGCDCTATCTNNPVNPTKSLHAPAWGPDLGSDGVLIPSAFDFHLNSTFLVFTPIVSFLHPAQHQRAVSSNLPAARCTSPAWWAHNLVPTCCIPGSHSTSAFSDPVISNPVAAALRLPAELCRPGGFIAAVGAAAAETQHYLKAAFSDWAKQLDAAASSVRSGLQRLAAWAASDDRSQQLGQAARSGQVSVTACTLTALHPCSWGDPAVLSVLWSEVLSGVVSVLPASLSVWWHVLLQFCAVNYNFIILLIVFLICAESVFQLVWRVTGCGQELADAYSLIAASPQVHRMALRLQLYRSATGRQFKRFRTVRVLLRPQALHSSFSHTSRALGRAIAYGTALAMVLFIAVVACALPRVQAYYTEHFYQEPAVQHACWVEFDAEQLGAHIFVCGAQDSFSPRWDWGGAATALSPIDTILEQLGAAWRAISEFLELEGAAYDRCQWSAVTAVTSPGAQAPLLVSPRPDQISLFPTYSTILHTSLAEDRQTLQTLRSSAALEALDKSYQHQLLPILNPVLAAQQLCQHGRYPQFICTVAALCAGEWVRLLAAVLGSAFIPGAMLLLTLFTIELSRRVGPQSSIRWALGILFNTDLGYDDGILTSGGLAFRVESVPRRKESAAAADQSTKRGGCCKDASCCHHGERPEPAPTTEVCQARPEATTQVCPVRETDVPLTGAADRGPSQTWETPAARAFEPPSPASVDVKQDVPGLATRTPVTTSVGVTHRSGCGVNGLTGWLETCSLTPFRTCLHFCCCLQSLLHFCSDPLSHCIQHSCFAVARTIIEQSAQTHPTKQNGVAASKTQQTMQKPHKYNFIIHKNCSCHSKQHKIQNSNPKTSCSQNPNHNPNSNPNSNPILEFQQPNPNSQNLTNLSPIPIQNPNSQKFLNFPEITEIPEIPRIPKQFTISSLHIICCHPLCCCHANLSYFCLACLYFYFAGFAAPFYGF
jgi:hypothetical protein